MMLWLIDRIVTAILVWLASKGIRLRKQIEMDGAIDRRTEAEAEALKNAQTDEEFDEAARDILNR